MACSSRIWRMRPGFQCFSRLLRPREPLRPALRCWRFNSTSAAPPLTSSDPSSSPGIRLREYQEECIQSVLKYLDEGHKRLGISLATGAGKTVIFTQLISRIPPRNKNADQSLIIVHRKELVEQAAHHCRLAYPDKSIEVEMGNNKASGAADITIASIQSLLSKDRIKKFNPDRFKLVLVDEAHHIVAESYRKALGHFGLKEFSDNSPALVGVSATFSRFDGLKLGAAIDHIVYHKDYVDMISENWLADAIFTTVQSEADLSAVRKDQYGDFAVKQLSEAVNTIKTNEITVRAWLSNASDRKSTLVFCVDIQHAMDLTATFRDHGIDARYITNRTPRTVRDEQLRAFKNREYPVLLNCGLFTEGTDIPNVDCVLLARPTRSKNLLIQMIGRGLRLYPGKEDCHIIDMVSSLRTGVLTTPTLFGLDPDEALNKSKLKDLKEAQEGRETAWAGGPAVDGDVNVTFTKYDSIFDLINDTEPEQHIRSMSPYAWVRLNKDRYVLSERSGWLTINKDESGHFRVDYVMKLPKDDLGRTTFARPRTVATAEDLEQAVRAADTFAKNKFDEFLIGTWQPWRKSKATAAQLNILNGRRIRDRDFRPGELTKGQATDLITKLKFGGKRQFMELKAWRKKKEREQREMQELLSRDEVKVGPLNA
ncbi:hypothetical protein VTN02DRAFT_4258 [Thermoascus thermophilus]